MNASIASLRQEYASEVLLEHTTKDHPIDQFRVWWQQVIQSQISEPNAMTLATASAAGLPAARIVLLKDFDENGFTFFTNYNSNKAVQLQENPKASLVFFWKELERQVRITGTVSKTPEQVSDQYFNSRPRGSRLGAWASPQSQVISGRNWLDEHYITVAKEFEQKEITRPSNWGGFTVQPFVMEFWQGRPSRLHDRVQYTLQQNGTWQKERLAP